VHFDDSHVECTNPTRDVEIDLTMGETAGANQDRKVDGHEKNFRLSTGS
jgi:hypothetical protein